MCSPTALYIPRLLGVYRHDLLGVFTTLTQAKAHSEAVFADSDGHHTVVIEAHHVGVGMWPSKRGGFRHKPQGIHEDSKPVDVVFYNDKGWSATR
jgi:hypothetical protein